MSSEKTGPKSGTPKGEVQRAPFFVGADGSAVTLLSDEVTLVAAPEPLLHEGTHTEIVVDSDARGNTEVVLEDDDAMDDATSVDIDLEAFEEEMARRAEAAHPPVPPPAPMADGPEDPLTVGSETAAVEVGDLESLEPLESLTQDAQVAMPGASPASPEGVVVYADQSTHDPDGLGMAFPGGGSGGVMGTRELDRPCTAGKPAQAEMSITAPAPEAQDHWNDFDEESLAGWDKSSDRLPALSEAPVTGEGVAVGMPKEHSRQHTGVAKQVSVSQAVGARLICLRGGDEGREFDIGGGELSVGRDPRCAIVLKEASVSREHALLHYDGERYMLIDQRSGNGSFVNGQRIDRERLRSGDEIAFGNGVYRFMELGDVFQPVDASAAPVQVHRAPQTPGMQSSVKVALLFGLLIFFGVGTVGFVGWQGHNRKQRNDIVYSEYMRGVAYFNAFEWAKAEAAFLEILKVVPGHHRAKNFVIAIGRERAAQQKLEEAKRAHAAQDYARAYGKAAEVEASPSVFAAEARALMRRVSAQLEAVVAKAGTDIAAGRAHQAILALRAVSAAQPGRTDIQRLIRRAQLVTGSPLPPRTGQGGLIAAPSGVPQGTPGLTQIRALFGEGKKEQALQALSALGAAEDVNTLRGQILAFQTAYDEAVAFYRSKNISAAIKSLMEALKIDAEISGGASALAREIAQQLANMHYAQAQKAQAAQRYPEAVSACRAALAVFSVHAPCLALLKQLETVYEP